MKRINYPYLNDKDFLKEVDSYLNQRQYVKITLLNWDETEIKDIEGIISSGSITKDASSSVRRTCSLTCVVDKYEYNAFDLKNDFSINKKVYINIGVENQSTEYADYPILWFPQGLFLITDCSISSSVESGISVSLSFKDKMALLDGTISGVIQQSTDFDTVKTWENGVQTSEKVLIYDIIMELVNHFGDESLNNIVIEDVPTSGKRLLRWNGESNICKIVNKNNNSLIKIVHASDYDTAVYPKGTWTNQAEYEQGDDVGYEYTDLIYDTTLSCSAGATVTSVLDTIKNWLGNFEYFYDEFGVFHFREIKNYLTTSKSTKISDQISEGDYSFDCINSKSSYAFTTGENIKSLSTAPQYGNIKNNFYVYGQENTSSNTANLITYHLAVDKKPNLSVNGYSGILVYHNTTSNTAAIDIPIITEPNGSFGVDVAAMNLSKNYVNEWDKDYIYSKDNTISTAATIDDTKAKGLLPTNSNNASIYGILDVPVAAKFVQNASDETSLKNHYTRLWNCLNYYSTKTSQPSDIAAINTGLNQFNIEDSAANAVITEIQNKYTSTTETYKCCADMLNYITTESTIYNDRGFVFLPTAASSGVPANFAATISLMNNVSDHINRIDTNGLYISLLDSISDDASVIEATKTTITSIKELINEKILPCYTSMLSLLKSLATYYYNEEELTTDTNPGYYMKANSIKQALYTNFYQYNNSAWDSLPWYNYYHTVEAKSGLPFGIAGYNNTGFNSNEEGSATTETVDYGTGADIIEVSKSTYSMCTDSAWYQEKIVNPNSSVLAAYKAIDWRTELLLQGMQAAQAGTETNDYYTELSSYWYMTYNLNEQKFYNNYTGKYFLDFIDESSTKYGEYSINNIGKRTYVDSNSSSVNCLFAPEIPEIYLVPNGDENKTKQAKTRANETNIIYVDANIFNSMITGTARNPAFDQIKYDLMQYTSYQRSLNITCLPVFYLDVNTRVSVNDALTNTYGDYIITNISYSLGSNREMTITCTEAQERF